jgi:hypothetical protein
MSRPTGCPCGCLPGVDCITERRTCAPAVQFCPRTAVLRWHLAGHPDLIGGAA